MPPPDRYPQVADELKVDGERDQVLLNALVQGTFDPAPVRIGGKDEALPRCAELRDFVSKPVERLGQCLDVPGLQASTSSS